MEQGSEPDSYGLELNARATQVRERHDDAEVSRIANISVSSNMHGLKSRVGDLAR